MSSRLAFTSQRSPSMKNSLIIPSLLTRKIHSVATLEGSPRSTPGQPPVVIEEAARSATPESGNPAGVPDHNPRPDSSRDCGDGGPA